MNGARVVERLGELAAVLLIAVGCAGNPAPVPVVGEPDDIEHLAGKWTGTYESRDTDRHGSIVFVLEASRDTAHGDVLMVHRQGAVDYVGDYETLTLHERSPSPPRVVQIRFVVVDGERVFGVMEPYRDPECGCELRTEFEGILDEGVVGGTFRSEHLESGKLDRGTWTVSREDR